MWPKLIFCIFLILFPVAVVIGQENGPVGSGSDDPNANVAALQQDGSGDSKPKMVSGMSILGNKEAPMSLVIVPWKSSELGAEAKLTRTLNERRAPVDRDVFLREVAFYQVSAGSRGSETAAAFQASNAR